MTSAISSEVPARPMGNIRHEFRHELGRAVTFMKGSRDHSRRNPIDANSVGSELLGQSFGVGQQAALGRRIGRGAQPSAVSPGDGRNVDDAAALARRHLFPHGLGAQEDALQVQVHDLIPILLGHVRQGAPSDQVAGIVHQDVNAPPLFAYRRHQGMNLVAGA